MSAALPGVTYIVTIYNKAPYLEGVIRALAKQEGGFERQYVLVDDGSTDGSDTIAARLAAKLANARFIRQDENRGPSLAVNRGLAAAKLPFTQVIDSDDVLAPYATKLLLQAALKSGCGAVYGRNARLRIAGGVALSRGARRRRRDRTDRTRFIMSSALGHAGGSTYITRHRNSSGGPAAATSACSCRTSQSRNAWPWQCQWESWTASSAWDRATTRTG